MYVPLGGALRELRLCDAHLPAAPEALASLAPSLTLLSLGLCQGFSEVQRELPCDDGLAACVALPTCSALPPAGVLNRHRRRCCRSRCRCLQAACRTSTPCSPS